jgi:hypothetical protein
VNIGQRRILESGIGVHMNVADSFSDFAILTARVSGNFLGSTVTLKFTFVIEGGKIATPKTN